MDNLVNFAKRAPVKLRKMWQANYYIQDKDITSKCELKPRVEQKLDSKSVKRIVQDIHRKRNERFKRVAQILDEFRNSEVSVPVLAKSEIMMGEVKDIFEKEK